MSYAVPTGLAALPVLGRAVPPGLAALPAVLQAPNVSFTSPAVVFLGVAVTLTPINTGGAITSASATLPSWADPVHSDGTITGTPDALGDTTVSDYSASNAAGTGNAPSFIIRVLKVTDDPGSFSTPSFARPSSAAHPSFAGSSACDFH